MKNIFVLSFILVNPFKIFAAEMCSVADNAIYPEIKVSIVKQKEGSYRYKYTVLNHETSKLPIKWFLIETYSSHADVALPPGWTLMNWGEADSRFLKMATSTFRKNSIEVGKMLAFAFTSKNKPGYVKYRNQGENYTPVIYQNVSYESVKGLCPGSYQSGSSIPGFEDIEGMTIGPIPENQISPEIRIKRPTDKNWTGQYQSQDSDLLSISPIETGKIEVALLKSDELNPEEINISTIEFGRGKVKPLKVSVANCQLSSEASTKALIMTFDLYSINVLCNTDHALFLTAKTKEGKDVFGGVKIRPTECSQENWKREADKMIEAGELDLPKGEYKTKG